MSDQFELARREQRAQQGIVQFAEEMQVIREGDLYPGAGTCSGNDPWGTYCHERWGMSRGKVDDLIRAHSVLARFALESKALPSVEKARTVATLPTAVQDAILTSDPKAVAEDDVKAKAKAARKTIKAAADEGREATDEELVAATEGVKSIRPKPKHRKKSSKFTSRMEKAYYEIQQAADIAQGDTLTDVENDYGWNRVAKMRYELDRIEERLYRPEIVKDADAEFAELLGGEAQ